MHAIRRSFDIKEQSEKMRLALRKRQLALRNRFRVNNEVYYRGDEVHWRHTHEGKEENERESVGKVVRDT